MSALPTPGGNNGQASAMNNRGQLTRFAETAIPDSTCPAGVTSKTDSPVVWEDGQAHALPMVGSDPDGEANGIDEEGQAVGYSGICTAALHGGRWEKGTVFQLPDLGTGAIAFGINDRGQIVGTIGSPDGTTQFAALWQNGAPTNLGTLKGGFGAIASGINSRGQVVGSTQDANFSFVRAFIWQDGVMTDLHTVSCRFQPPRNHGQQYQLGGQIAGMATVLSGPHTGETQAFLATPVEASAGRSVADVATTHPKLPANVGMRLVQRCGRGRFDQ